MKNVLKSVIAKLPPGGSYTFDNFETTVHKPDGSAKTVVFNGESEKLMKDLSDEAI